MGPSPSPARPEVPHFQAWRARTLCGFGQALTLSGVCRCRRLSLGPGILGPAVGGGVWIGWSRNSQELWGRGSPCCNEHPGP